MIHTGATPRHVPAVVAAVPDIPYTISGKKVELAVLEGDGVVRVEEIVNHGGRGGGGCGGRVGAGDQRTQEHDGSEPSTRT